MKIFAALGKSFIKIPPRSHPASPTPPSEWPPPPQVSHLRGPNYGYLKKVINKVKSQVLDHHIKIDTWTNKLHLFLEGNKNKHNKIMQECTFSVGHILGQNLCFFWIGLLGSLKWLKSFSFTWGWWLEDGGCARLSGSILGDDLLALIVRYREEEGETLIIFVRS